MWQGKEAHDRQRSNIFCIFDFWCHVSLQQAQTCRYIYLVGGHSGCAGPDHYTQIYFRLLAGYLRSAGQSRSLTSLLLFGSEWALSVHRPLERRIWVCLYVGRQSGTQACPALSLRLFLSVQVVLHVQLVLSPDRWPFLPQVPEHWEGGRK